MQDFVDYRKCKATLAGIMFYLLEQEDVEQTSVDAINNSDELCPTMSRESLSFLPSRRA